MGLLIVKDSTDTNKIITMPAEAIHGVELEIHNSTTEGQSVSLYMATRLGRFGEKKRNQTDAQIEASKTVYAAVLDLMSGKRDVVNFTDFDYKVPAKKQGAVHVQELTPPETDAEPTPPPPEAETPPDDAATEGDTDTEPEEEETK